MKRQLSAACAIIGVLTFLSCGQQPNAKSTATIKVKMQSLSQPQSLMVNQPEDLLGIFTAPTTVSGFNCYAVNVVGPGIQNANGSLPSNSQSYPSCTYPGVLSQPISSSASTTTVNLPVPKGAQRLVQMLGVVDGTSTGAGCGGGQSLFQAHASSGGIDLYEIGRTVIDVFTDVTATITDTYATLTTAAQQASTQVNCANAPSTIATPTPTPTAALSYLQTIEATTSLSYYWPLNDSYPSPTATASYLAGAGNGLTPYNLACTSTNAGTTETGFTAVPSGSLYWTGSTSDCMNTALSSGFNLGTNFTIEMWVYAVNVASTQSLFAVASTSATGCSTYACEAVFHLSSGVPSLVIGDGTQAPQTFNATSGISANAWHHVAVTYNGSTVAFYVDGVADGTGTFTSSTGVPVNSVGHLYFGFDGTYYFNGAIESLAIYSQALSQSTLFTHYTRGTQSP